MTGIELVTEYLRESNSLRGKVYESPGLDLLAIEPFGRNVIIYVFAEPRKPHMVSIRIERKPSGDRPAGPTTSILNLIRGIDLHEPDSLQTVSKWVKDYSGSKGM